MRKIIEENDEGDCSYGIGKDDGQPTIAVTHTLIKNSTGFEIMKEVKHIIINSLEKISDHLDYVTPEYLTYQMASLGLAQTYLAGAAGTFGASVSRVKRSRSRNRSVQELEVIKRLVYG